MKERLQRAVVGFHVRFPVLHPPVVVEPGAEARRLLPRESRLVPREQAAIAEDLKLAGGRRDATNGEPVVGVRRIGSEQGPVLIDAQRESSGQEVIGPACLGVVFEGRRVEADCCDNKRSNVERCKHLEGKKKGGYSYSEM